jgi:hypothetical protein
VVPASFSSVGNMSTPLAIVIPSGEWPDPSCVVAAIDILTTGGFAVRADQGQEEWTRQLRQSRCAVVLGASGLPPIVESLDEAVAGPPLIVIRRSWSRRTNSLGCPVHAVLTRGELVPDLLRVATNALIEDVFRSLRDAVRLSAVLSKHRWVQRAVMVTLTEPTTSVQAMAGRVGCTRQALSSWWAAANQDLRTAGGSDLPRPKQLLKSICFLRVVDAWLSGRDLRSQWGPTAVEIGVHRTTVTRLVRETTGKPPGEVRVEELPELVTRIEESLLRALLSGDRPTVLP